VDRVKTLRGKVDGAEAKRKQIESMYEGKIGSALPKVDAGAEKK
jgi:hypothetical protein